MIKKQKEKEETVHFYRGKLPTIVWDKRHDRALIDFKQGHIYVSDPFTIAVLREIGYIEIPLEATAPPEIIEPLQPAGMPDVKQLPRGLTEKGAAEIQKQKVVTEDKDGPAVPVPKTNKTTTGILDVLDTVGPELNPVVEEEKREPAKKSKKKKRTIKRR